MARSGTKKFLVAEEANHEMMRTEWLVKTEKWLDKTVAEMIHEMNEVTQCFSGEDAVYLATKDLKKADINSRRHTLLSRIKRAANSDSEFNDFYGDFQSFRIDLIDLHTRFVDCKSTFVNKEEKSLQEVKEQLQQRLLACKRYLNDFFDPLARRIPSQQPDGKTKASYIIEPATKPIQNPVLFMNNGVIYIREDTPQLRTNKNLVPITQLRDKTLTQIFQEFSAKDFLARQKDLAHSVANVNTLSLKGIAPQYLSVKMVSFRQQTAELESLEAQVAAFEVELQAMHDRLETTKAQLASGQAVLQTISASHSTLSSSEPLASKTSAVIKAQPRTSDARIPAPATSDQKILSGWRRVLRLFFNKFTRKTTPPKKQTVEIFPAEKITRQVF